MRRVIPVAIVVLVFVAHFGGIITSYDSRWSIPTARSIVHEGNTDLEEYRTRIAADPGSQYALELVNGRYHAASPLGVSLIAGSIFVFGRPGVRVGAGMKRGTIALWGELPGLLPTFRYDCEYRPVFLALYLRQLRAWGFPLVEESSRGMWRRFSGDLVALGKGEVLHWQAGVS